MKKFLLLLSIALMVCSLSATAATITNLCSVTNNPGVINTIGTGGPFGAPLTASCSGFSSLPAGSVITNVQMAYTVDLLFDNFNPPASSNWSIAVSIGTANNVSGSISNTSRPIGPTTLPGDNNAADILAYQSPFTVTFASSNPSGSVQGNSYSVRFIETYTSGVPEPASMSLIGLGILGLGLVGNKLRK